MDEKKIPDLDEDKRVVLLMTLDVVMSECKDKQMFVYGFMLAVFKRIGYENTLECINIAKGFEHRHRRIIESESKT